MYKKTYVTRSPELSRHGIALKFLADNFNRVGVSTSRNDIHGSKNISIECTWNHRPDWKWRLIFALSRFGGLRCPSEHLALTWADVDREGDRIRVRTPRPNTAKGAARD